MMKALVKQTINTPLQLMDYPDPTLAEDEVLVKVRSAGICGTDLKILNNQYPYCPPVIPGHEFSGEVLQVGAKVNGLQIGDRVTAEMIQTFCNHCEYCRTGHYALCEERRGKGMVEDGAFAEMVSLKAAFIYKLPAQLSPEEGVLLEPLSCVTHGLLEQGVVHAGDRVLIIGLGAIGLLGIEVAGLLGCSVDAVGKNGQQKRLELGEKLGAVVTEVDFSRVDASTAEPLPFKDYDVVVDCAGSESSVNLALHSVKKRGTVIQLGIPKQGVTVKIGLIAQKEIRLVGSLAHTDNSWRRSLWMAQENKVTLTPLITGVFPFSDWEKAFQEAGSGTAVKVVINF